MGTYTEQAKEYVRSKCGAGDIWPQVTDCLKDYGWNLRWLEVGSNWHLRADETTVLVTASWEAIEAFVYGLLYGSLAIAHTGEVCCKRNLLLEIMPAPESNLQLPLVAELFDDLQTIEDRLLVFEWQYLAPARSWLLYKAYKEKTYPPEQEKDFDRIGQLYERKLELERKLKALTADNIRKMLNVQDEPPYQLSLPAEEQLAVVFAFLTLYLGWHSPLHKIEGRWHFWIGDLPLFIGEDELEIRSFLYGIAYVYTCLPSGVVERLRRPLIR